MTKLRVYELAKQYGMKGPEMAEYLRNLGFSVKGHMSALDDADQMRAIGMLEAQGLRSKTSKPPADTDTDTDTGSGTSLKRIPKKRSLKKALPPAGTKPKKVLGEAAKPEPVAATATETATEEPVAETPTPAPEPEATPQAPAKEVPAAKTEADSAASPEAEATGTETASAETTDAPASTAPDESVAAPSQEKPPASAADSAPADAAAEATEAPAKPPAEERVVKRLIKPQMKAKVVGKVQLPESTIRDANRRSAPRDPNSVDHALRMKALSHTSTRSATRTGPGRRGPGIRGGPARGRGRDQGRGRRKSSGIGSISTPIDPDKIIEIEPPITVKGLSEALGVKVNELIAALTFKLKIAGKTINSFLDEEEVELIGLETERNIKIVEHKEAEKLLLETFVSASEDISSDNRAPVLTFMGHVDHGKTTLLDALRSSDVVKGEAGGITQHIGAYKITTKGNDELVVLDTPGHAAFTSMRARGASLTDIVVLVVAADDGVMPQTEEAINHALQAKVPIVVAVNKSDTPGANPMQTRQQLSVKGLQAEEWGGNVQMVNVSALTGQGLDELTEKIFLEAELLELQAKPEAPGSGVVIESRQSAKQGIVVNVLVTDGTLRVRDMVICGESHSRVRGMVDDHGKRITEAGPSTPVSITGLAKLPTPGDKFFVVENAKKAKEVVDERQRRARANDLADRSRITAENIAAKIADQQVDEFKVILKADVTGSLEPIRNGLADIGTDEVRVNIIHRGLGAVTENDVSLAEASEAIIIGFNTIPEPAARVAADRAGVEIRHYEVIYKLLDDLKLALEGLLKPDEIEEVEGHAEIKAIFKSSKFGNISGCLVTDGFINRNHRVRVTRDGTAVYRSKLGSLRRIDDDVREVKSGYECGLTVTDFNDVKIGDELEFFTVKFVPRKLE